jgi:hypothetical protein
VLDEVDVTPRHRAEVTGVVVARSAQTNVVRQQVPCLAGDGGTTSPWYCHESYLYERLFSSKPENQPSISLVSRKRSSMIVDILV